MKAPPASLRVAFAALHVSAAALAGGVAPLLGPLLGMSAAAQAAEGTRFVAGMGDVPAMPGLEPTAVEPLVFDKPSGRIVEAVLRGPVSRSSVQGFYARTLPQLGWRSLPDGRYLREGEELRLEFMGMAAGQTTVRLVLEPQ